MCLYLVSVTLPVGWRIWAVIGFSLFSWLKVCSVEHLAHGKGPLNMFLWESKWVNGTNVLRLKVGLMKILVAFRSEVSWKTTHDFEFNRFSKNMYIWKEGVERHFHEAVRRSVAANYWHFHPGSCGWCLLFQWARLSLSLSTSCLDVTRGNMVKCVDNVEV